MTTHWNKKEIFVDVAIFVIMGIYSYLLHLSSALIILELIFTLPIILYIYRKNLNKRFIAMAIGQILLHTVFYDPVTAFIFVTLYLLPAILIGRLMRANKALSLTIGVTTLLFFLNVILSIFVYNQMYQTDFVNKYYWVIDQAGYSYQEEVVEEMLELNPSLSRAEFIDAIHSIVQVLKHYYIAILFNISFFIVSAQALIARLCAHLCGWQTFSIKRIFLYTPPRNFTFFFAFLFVLQSLIDQPQVLMSVDNLIIIAMMVMLGVGFLYSCYLNARLKSVIIKIVLMIMSLMVLIIHPLIFVGVGFFEILFRSKEKIKL